MGTNPQDLVQLQSANLSNSAAISPRGVLVHTCNSWSIALRIVEVCVLRMFDSLEILSLLGDRFFSAFWKSGGSVKIWPCYIITLPSWPSILSTVVRCGMCLGRNSYCKHLLSYVPWSNPLLTLGIKLIPPLMTGILIKWAHPPKKNL